MFKNIGLPGSHFEANQGALLANYTGAATILGGVGFIDVTQTNAASVDIPSALNNVVKPTTALIATCPFLVVATDANIANGSAGRFTGGDGIRCRIYVDGTTDIAKGDKLKPVNAQVYMAKATTGVTVDPTATAGTFDFYYAIALEAFTTDGQGVIEAILYSSGRR